MKRDKCPTLICPEHGLAAHTAKPSSLLSAYQACIGYIDESLVYLAAELRQGAGEIVVHGVYSSAPSEFQRNLVECMATELLSDVDPDFNVRATVSHGGKAEILSAPGETLFVAREFAWRLGDQPEVGWIKVGVQNGPPKRPELLLWGHRAILGRVDRSLRRLAFEIVPAQRSMQLFFLYKEELGDFQADLANEIQRDLGKKLHPWLHVTTSIQYSSEPFRVQPPGYPLFRRAE